MTDNRKEEKPSLWERALAIMRGGDMAGLVEQFTREMTMVAEGLCEDQARLRKAVETLGEQNRIAADALNTKICEQAQQIEELTRRIETLERQAAWRRTGGWRRLVGDRLPWGRLLLGAAAVILLRALLW